MLLIDVSILINAHRKSQTRHREFQQWLEETVSSGQPFSVPSIVRSGFIRIITQPKAFPEPTPLETALQFMESLQKNENHVEVVPGERHWSIFTDLCRRTRAKGNLVADVYLAALAIECGGEWITADKDYSKFPGLNWRHPLDGFYNQGGNTGSFSAREPRRRYRARIRTAVKTS